MFSIRQWKSLVTWLAVAAMLAAALLPAVSHALASERIENIMLAEICAPSGMSYGAVMGDDGKAPGKQAGHMDDCPYCRLASDVPALPGAGLTIEPALAAAPLPPLFYLSPAPLFTWVAAKPRGPPFLA
ncbi:MAG TPA: DUF2946 domain-containing protein [Pseudoduganella sp.]|jgi:hypothetical protein